MDSRSLHIAGEKFGVCVRCTSIYFSFLAGVLLAPVVRRLDSKSVPRPAWIIAAILPMALDAVLNDLGILASSEVSRVITGSLAGFVFAFFIVPVFVEAITQLLVHRTLQGDTRYAGKTE
ncbi:MAG TPA: DUF2085 domain-containing protein [Bacteroidota bacterium]|nr:DUF2085 domain-containing protein [Bacteroidota bacterium]